MGIEMFCMDLYIFFVILDYSELMIEGKCGVVDLVFNILEGGEVVG